MKQVICIDDKYPPEASLFYIERNINIPILHEFYTPRQIIRHTTGAIGLRFEELINDEVLIKHPILNEILYEPTWNINRFRNLDGSVINVNQLEKLL